MAGTLVTLMWRHFTVRKRRYINTTAELFYPIICLLALFILWECLSPQPMFSQLAETNVDHKKTFPLASKGVTLTPMIMYTPDNEFTRTLMDAAGEKLNLPRLDSFSVSKDHKTGFLNIGYYGFTNNSELLDFLAHIEINEAIIIFEDYGHENPRKLDYTIRLKEDYITHIFETLDRVSPQLFQFAQMYSPFMQIQWAIDSSYIELKSGKPLNMTVSTQKFPYDDWQPSDMASIICVVLQLLCSLALVIPFVFLVTRLMEERATGVPELIKMVGVSSNKHSVSHLLNAALTGLVFSVGGALLLTLSSTPIVSSSTLLIAVMLALYYLTVVATAFVWSFISKSSDHLTWLALVEYVLLWLPVLLMTTHDVPMSRTLMLLTGLFPHMPMYWFWNEVSTLEQYGKTLDFSTMWSSHSAQSGSVFQCYVLMVLQFVLMAFLVAYVGNGVPLPWNFYLQKQYWCEKVKSDKLSDAAEEEPIMRDPKHFEPPPHADVAISINNVSKVFGKERVLDNVSFDVYKGEITVLLGHNGAGKTTLMSIITGMISATEGKVFLNGRDASEARRAARNEIGGVCPQNNLFFPDLTVIEHVMFFSLLKGVPFAEARKSSQKLLDQLGVAYKANSATDDLSGGMKRRLQLACAFAGGSSILVLDEPTSGLDVETRRELWDTLLTLRGERTVLLTTHYMEEADALGDRVAALHAGQLRCHATPMHLKKNQGTGYRLSLTTTCIPNEPAITSVVTGQVSAATLKGKGLNSISYSLPASSSDRFPQLFTMLEAKRSELGVNSIYVGVSALEKGFLILPASSSDRFPQLFTMLEAKRSELGVDSIGVGVSTLEEVFLSDDNDDDTLSDEDTVDVLTEEHVKLVGFALCIHQMLVLMKRQYRYTMSKIISFLIGEVAIPIIIIFLVVYFALNGKNLQNASVKQSNGISMDLNLYKHMPDRRVLYNLDDESYLRKVKDHHPEVDFEMTSDVADAVLRKGRRDLLDYKKYLAGIEVNDTSSKILYTTKVQHSAPVALNILSNVLATRVGLDDDIITNNQPVTSSYVPEITRLATLVQTDTAIKEPKKLTLCKEFAMVFVLVLLATALDGAVSLPCKERISSTRHLHRLAGCSPTVVWLSTLLPHTALYMLVTALPMLLAAAIADAEHTLDQSDLIGCLFILTLAGLMAFLAFAYHISYRLTKRQAVVKIGALIIVFGLISRPQIETDHDVFELGDPQPLLVSVYYFFPPHTLVSGFINAINVARVNAYCTLNKDKCPLIPVTNMYRGFDLERCCAMNENSRCYFCFDTYSPMKELIMLIFQTILYMGLVIIAQYSLPDKRKLQPPTPTYNDEMVRVERTYVEKSITLPSKQIPDALLVHNIYKKYDNKIFRKSCKALKGVSFCVKKGECFGVLGVNGAGKTTVCKIITGEEAATNGEIFANGHHLKCARSQYLNSLSYCPQFSGLDDFLTGKENLQLLLTLRGLSTVDVLKESEAWIKVLGLEKYKNQKVSEYSGDCQRLLGTAAALCTGAPVTVLDEPTAGVDVSARRRVWAALRTALQQGRAIIITSHSMDEMEALCARIAIMSAGEVCALGSPSALRAAHTSGHAVMFKIRSLPQDVETDIAMEGLLSLKNKLRGTFDCTLKDVRVSTLYCHINKTMGYSDLFTALEDLKASFPHLIEDYTVSETTLQEVFMSLVKGAVPSKSLGEDPVPV